MTKLKPAIYREEMITENASALSGRIDGHHLGWRHGYFFGRCEAIFRKVPTVGLASWQVKVLYVEGGLFNLNQGIIDALGGMVRELVVAGAFEDIVAIAQRENPDIVIVLNGIHGFDDSQLEILRNHGFKTAVWFADDPYFLNKTTGAAPLYDFVFTHELGVVPYYKRLGCQRVYYLPLAANPYIFRPERVDTSYRTDVCFVGTGFENRIQFFNQSPQRY